MFSRGETALTVTVPAAERVVGPWRERYDPSTAYGVPAHVTVLYPFLDAEEVDEGALRELFGACERFDLVFERAARFPGLVYLVPEPAEPVRRLTEAVVARWPEAQPYRGKHGEITPHLTVGQGLDEAGAVAIERGLDGLPVRMRVSGVTLEVFDGERWRRRACFPFGEVGEAEFGFPGPLRDKLVAAILAGAKTATSSLLLDHEHAGEPLPVAGSWDALIDSAGRRVALLETTEVRVVPIREIDDAFARDEGEGYSGVGEWRAGHERFWLGPEHVAYLGGRAPVIDDDTLVVTERFRLLQTL
ncbi:2'-5' RNA ligase family protein [Nonomuraea sp. NPDC050790]|uniref:2'-5' RNA ligase family protein n=1 Tax=Nonomuraea sp. NPDC050790 TaxID=3364371 RepID=UPI0037B56A85